MCKNQLGRRNLTPEQKTYLTGKQYEAERKTLGASDGFRGNQYAKVVNDQSGHLPKQPTTRQRIAKETGTSEVQRAEIYARELDEAETLSPGFREAVLSGEVKAPQSAIRSLATTPEEKRPAAVEAIKRGEIREAQRP